jgi:ABC-type xylose transport system permease subunit
MDESRAPASRMSDTFGHRVASLRKHIDPAIAWAFGCIVLVLLVGSLYSSSFLSPEYLLQQLKVASFLGIIATGTMVVILLGQIDLSVPWVVAVGGMMSTAAAGWGPLGDVLAIPVGVACGVALGLVSGVSSHSVDGRHLGGERGGARADGRAHRRLFAAGRLVVRDALPCDRP